MLRAVAILLVSLAISLAANAKPQGEEFKLRAKVLDVVMLSEYSGAVMPVDFDPRFAVAVRVDFLRPSLANFTKGAKVTFAVHSPSNLFSAENPKGKTYDFTLRRETADGKTGFSSLEVRR